MTINVRTCRHDFGYCLLFSLAMTVAASAVPIEPPDFGGEKWASVRGQIIFGGEKVPDPIPVNTRGGGLQFIESWIVHPKSKGVKNVIVWLGIETKDRGIRMPMDKIHPDLRKIPTAAVEIDVRGKQYSPTAFGLRGGQKLIFRNSADEACDFKYQTLESAGNVIVVPGKTYDVPALRAETYPLMISSSLFPWMKCHGRVFDHPYFAVTDEEGRFEIRQAPVGKLRLWLWHPESGFRDGAKGRDGDPIDVRSRGLDVGVIKISPLKDQNMPRGP